jgi:hypothetical protein
MVAEEIITSLRNAVEHGDSLENAMQLAINSGYNSKDVQEAAQYVSGISVNFAPKPGEQLSMPAQKKIISGNPVNTIVPQQNKFLQPTQPITNQITNIRQDNQAIKQNISYGSVYENPNQPSFYSEVSTIKPKESYTKEIILLIFLIFLIGVLIASFLFKEDILKFFSSL